MAGSLELLAGYKQPITEAIEQSFDEFVAQLPPRSTHVNWALDALKSYSLRPSKKVRGSLAAAMYDHAAGTRNDLVGLKLAAAIELVQNYLLIVDDAMDRSPLRRGHPTVHELYKAEYTPESEREADMVAILIGILAQHITNDIVLRLNVPAEHAAKALSVIQVNIATTDMGQIDDVQQQIDRLPISPEDLLRKYQHKSSYYSFVNPLESALALAGKWSNAAHKDCIDFGLPAGVAFQLRDDYLGIFGDTTATGKANLEDIREGKYTFMVQYALDVADAETRQQLMEILGKPDANETDLQTVRTIFKNTSAAEKSMEDARHYAAEATRAAAGAASWDAEFSNLLVDMVNFSVEREG